MVSTLPKPRPACDSRRGKFVLYGICTDALRESPFVRASNCIEETSDFRSYHKMPIIQNMLWWARQGLNLRPHPCEGRVRLALMTCNRWIVSRFRNGAVRVLYILYENRRSGRGLQRPFSRLPNSRSTASCPELFRSQSGAEWHPTATRSYASRATRRAHRSRFAKSPAELSRPSSPCQVRTVAPLWRQQLVTQLA